MMKLKVYSILLCLLFAQQVMAQVKLSGKIVSDKPGVSVEAVSVALNQKLTVLSDQNGEFEFLNVPKGVYTLQTFSINFKASKQSITVKDKDLEIKLLLSPKNQNLKEVLISEKQGDFGQTRMRGVEAMGIYEGKKSEVILTDQLVANLATNNARQVYSRVAGLNIWENDGAGLQLSIGGRGLDPNRSANFNVRQNGYDISADALGYPESYYTPTVEAVERIQVVRGAASLQYGTQFGGLINFVMRKPVDDKKLALTMRQTVGSFNFNNSFLSASGTVKKLSYYSFIQYKKGDGWRPNSKFGNVNAFANVNYQINEKTKIGLDYSHTDYLAQQPGGLSDDMFVANARQSNRERNWFKVNWNLFALHFDRQINESSELNLRLFGLLANRYSLGFRPNRVATVDDNSQRDLITGDFSNAGLEARYLKRYKIKGKSAVLLLGSRLYYGYNRSLQGFGSNGKGADFNFVDEDLIIYDYRFPNRNLSLFAEQVFYLNDKFSLTPGLRAEYINTNASGYYGDIDRDLAGNIISKIQQREARNSQRQFVLAGLGISYKPLDKLNLYANISQNYRSITFSDMRIANPSELIDQNLQDEKGYSIDFGLRSNNTTVLNYDISLFLLRYNNRIGERPLTDISNRALRYRTNIGEAVISGLESFIELDLLKAIQPNQKKWNTALFGNLAIIQSEYLSSKAPGITGNEVEFVPGINFKSGFRVGYQQFKASVQYTYLGSQFSDATNAVKSPVSQVAGLIPAYNVLDLSLSYEWKKIKLEGSINNLLNEIYFTRRATGYPGPGILPSDGRAFYLTLQVKL